jgi:hypothetical protein
MSARGPRDLAGTEKLKKIRLNSILIQRNSIQLGIQKEKIFFRPFKGVPWGWVFF